MAGYVEFLWIFFFYIEKFGWDLKKYAPNCFDKNNSTINR